MYEQLKTHGPYYNSRKDWCVEAVNAHAGQCAPQDAVAWIMNNEVRLRAAEMRAKVDEKAVEGTPGEVDWDVAESSFQDLSTSWQKMVDSKVFKACENGNQHLEEIQEALDWGANIDSLHVQGRHPLHNAARNNQDKAITFLLAQGADPNASAGETG